MKKIEYNYFYDNRAISRGQFENEVGKNWKRKCVRDLFGEWHYGYYRACRREPMNDKQ